MNQTTVVQTLNQQQFSKTTYLKFSKNELTLHNNTWWIFLKIWYQMKTTAFHSLSFTCRHANKASKQLLIIFFFFTFSSSLIFLFFTLLFSQIFFFTFLFSTIIFELHCCYLCPWSIDWLDRMHFLDTVWVQFFCTWQERQEECSHHFF